MSDSEWTPHINCNHPEPEEGTDEFACDSCTKLLEHMTFILRDRPRGPLPIMDIPNVDNGEAKHRFIKIFEYLFQDIQDEIAVGERGDATKTYEQIHRGFCFLCERFGQFMRDSSKGGMKDPWHLILFRGWTRAVVRVAGNSKGADVPGFRDKLNRLRFDKKKPDAFYKDLAAVVKSLGGNRWAYCWERHFGETDEEWFDGIDPKK